MVLESIINDYFIHPLVNQTGEYNPINTITYAVIFFAAIYLLYEKVLKDRVKIDSKFSIAFVSFAILAAGLHVLKDMGILPPVIFDTPFIYGIMYFLFLISFSLSLAIKKFAKIEYWKTLLAITMIPASIIIIFILSQAQNTTGLFYIIISLVVSSSILYILNVKFPNIITKENLTVLIAHMVDASATFVSLQFFNYTEQHFLPTFFIEMFGPIAIFPLKFIVIGLVLYLFDKDMKNKESRTFFKLIILILGLAPGLRDALRLAVLS